MAFNQNDPVQLLALKDEIVNDPLGVGYKNSATPTDWKGDQVIADLLNDSANAQGSGTIERSLVDPQELVDVISVADWLTRTDAQRSLLQLQLAAYYDGRVVSTVSGTDNQMRANLLAIFDNTTASATRSRMISVVQRDGSRAEVLFGENSFISVGAVGAAFNLI